MSVSNKSDQLEITVQEYLNPYNALLMHKVREKELMDRANEHRLATLKAQFERRARRIVRINNS
ncbi:hypothetical protein G4Y79_11295 [Phototrophicus methaneseepsis]|uniref:Uncharacterized protein n=1 Tax=Phototrophicus methaneseepsis TaxID=2710758 RepID=A0A7S8EDE5_9CHLR|nr:hypothetical protein [Phototrophicus methaneseepsis]QPC84922.1 hypothetical protein G4Y79_11295 [Phototrophicus methaneseepsis]